MEPIQICRSLSREVGRLAFDAPVTHVYNPLSYARASVETYLERWARPGKEAVFLGMNPGPWGMAQTGIPFGEVSLVRDWMGIDVRVKKPRDEHPKRPVQGFACERSEVSGQRLWGWVRDRFGDPDAFFERFFVWNYCPLVFMEESGKNRTPDKLPAAESRPLFAACDEALARMVEYLDPEQVIGVGRFAEDRALAVLGEERTVGRVLHPSPASPIANRGWAPQAEEQLIAQGIEL